MRAATLLLAFAVACASDDCPTPDGFYRLQMNERGGGTCGPIADDVVDYAVTSRLAPECEGRRGPTPDQCGVDVDVTCESTTGNFVTLRGGWQQTFGPDHMTGEMFMQIRDPGGAVICASTYDLSLGKI